MYVNGASKDGNNMLNFDAAFSVVPHESADRYNGEFRDFNWDNDFGAGFDGDESGEGACWEYANPYSNGDGVVLHQEDEPKFMGPPRTRSLTK